MRPSPSVFRHLRPWVAGSCLVWLGIGLALLGFYEPRLPEVPSTSRAGFVATDVIEPQEDIVIPDRLGRGETLSDLLERNGFHGNDNRELTDALGEHLTLRRLKPGSEVEFRYATDGEASVWFEQGVDRVVRARRVGGEWLADVVQRELETRIVTLWGTLQGNLFDSMGELGETAPLTIAFANVLQWDFDFHSQSRTGDRFGAVVEKKYRDGHLVGYGDLKAVVYESGTTRLAAVLFPDADGRREYYDLQGQSMRKAFLRAPLEFHRISSGFSHSRLHSGRWEEEASPRRRLRGWNGNAGPFGRGRGRDVSGPQWRSGKYGQRSAPPWLRLELLASVSFCGRAIQGRPSRAEAGHRIRGNDRHGDRAPPGFPTAKTRPSDQSTEADFPPGAPGRGRLPGCVRAGA